MKEINVVFEITKQEHFRLDLCTSNAELIMSGIPNKLQTLLTKCFVCKMYILPKNPKQYLKQQLKRGFLLTDDVKCDKCLSGL